METKVIIIGPSTSGKTTLMKVLSDKTYIPMDESDSILTELNNGVYPHDDKYKMEVLVPKMVNHVLDLESTIFFSNTDYFQPVDLEKAREVGFKIIGLRIDKEKMQERNNRRVVQNNYNDLSEYFDGMLTYMEDIRKKGLFDKEIDASQTSAQIAEELLNFIV